VRRARPPPRSSPMRPQIISQSSWEVVGKCGWCWPVAAPARRAESGAPRPRTHQRATYCRNEARASAGRPARRPRGGRHGGGSDRRPSARGNECGGAGEREAAAAWHSCVLCALCNSVLPQADDAALDCGSVLKVVPLQPEAAAERGGGAR
jgi:hypothetical protein